MCTIVSQNTREALFEGCMQSGRSRCFQHDPLMSAYRPDRRIHERRDGERPVQTTSLIRFTMRRFYTRGEVYRAQETHKPRHTTSTCSIAGCSEAHRTSLIESAPPATETASSSLPDRGFGSCTIRTVYFGKPNTQPPSHRTHRKPAQHYRANGL